MAAPTLTAGAAAYAVGAATVPPPAGVGVGLDAVLIVAAQKEAAGSGTILCNDPTAVKLGEFVSTAAVSSGADTGNMRIAAFLRVVDTPTLPSFVVSGGTDVMYGQAFKITPPKSSTWSTAVATGQDITADATWSATLSSLDLAVDDLCVVVGMTPTDVTTPTNFTAEVLTASGITFGAATEVGEPDTTTGLDLGGFVFTQAVTAGSGNVAPTVTATVATITNAYGPTLLVRLRATPAVGISGVRLSANISAYLAFRDVRLSPVGWGVVLDPGTVRQPPSPDDSARMYVDITVAGAAYTHPNLVAQYDATAITGLSDGASVSHWLDTSPTAQHMDQSTAANQPIYKTNIRNGHPIVRFDTTDWLESNARTSTNMTLAIVKASASTAGTGLYFTQMSTGKGSGIGHQAGNRIVYVRAVAVVSGSATTLNWERLIMVCGPGSTQLYLNGVLDINSTTQMIAMNDPFVFRIGADDGGTQTSGSPNNLSQGMDVAEALAHNTNLNASEVAALDSYLATKWG